MNNYVRSALILLTVLFMGGCFFTQTPRPVAYPDSTQYKLQAAQHWNILASDVAKQIKAGLSKMDSVTQPVYVEPACGAPRGGCQSHEESPFGQGFRDLLMTHLVKEGVTTLGEIEEEALVVSSKVQVLYHKDKRRTRKLKPGMWTGIVTTLSAAIAVIRDAYDYGSKGRQMLAFGGGAIAAAALHDITDGSFVRFPHSEVIITTSIKDYNTYLMRKTDIYYINDADSWHYHNPPAAEMIEIRDS
ncbi:MAG: hypothetical protein GY749_09280 [Desulfobacteraceae bacterium]|nr:hypothetical protein [Desulfobacteraceae bacterium]